MKKGLLIGGYFHYLVFIGLFILLFFSFVWLYVLSKWELSYAYPLLALGYVFVSVVSWLWFNESFSYLRLSGLFVIVIGVYCMSRT